MIHKLNLIYRYKIIFYIKEDLIVKKENKKKSKFV